MNRLKCTFPFRLTVNWLRWFTSTIRVHGRGGGEKKKDFIKYTEENSIAHLKHQLTVSMFNETIPEKFMQKF